MSFVLATTALAAAGPIAHTNELRSLGVTRRELSRACAAGEILLVRRGVYAAVGTSDEFTHAAEHGGAPSCSAAGRMLGLWTLDEDEKSDAAMPHVPVLHLWVGHAGARHDCARQVCSEGPRVHWDDGTARLGKLPPVHNVLLQIAMCKGEENLFVALESALRQKMLSPGGLRWLQERVPESVRWLLAFARADADSGLESLIRLRLHRLGINVRTQVRIDGVGEVDFLIGDRLIIEADGKSNHDDVPTTDLTARRSLRHKDLLRDAKSAALGYETLRFDYALIVHDWTIVEAAIVTKLAAGAHLRR